MRVLRLVTQRSTIKITLLRVRLHPSGRPLSGIRSSFTFKYPGSSTPHRSIVRGIEPLLTRDGFTSQLDILGRSPFGVGIWQPGKTRFRSDAYVLMKNSPTDYSSTQTNLPITGLISRSHFVTKPHTTKSRSRLCGGKTATIPTMSTICRN